MYVMNVQKIFFIQYKPSAITWPAPEVFDVQEVIRGEETDVWWSQNYPKLQKFWEDLNAYEMPAAPRTLYIPAPKNKKARITKVSSVQCGLYGSDEDV